MSKQHWPGCRRPKSEPVMIPQPASRHGERKLIVDIDGVGPEYGSMEIQKELHRAIGPCQVKVGRSRRDGKHLGVAKAMFYKEEDASSAVESGRITLGYSVMTAKVHREPLIKSLPCAKCMGIE